MGTLRILRRWIVRFRAQGGGKEALLAMALTLAAAAFIAAALMGRDGGRDGARDGSPGDTSKAPVATVGKPRQ